MVRLSDVVPSQRTGLENLPCPQLPPCNLQPARELRQCRVALISSAGLMLRDEDNVPGNTSDYRTIPATISDGDVLMNHISVNFDRTAFAEDINSVLPRDRLLALAHVGTIESAAEHHYSFMGATDPAQMKQNVERLVNELAEREINTVCLLPV